LIYTRDLAVGYSFAALQAAHAHVRAHLSAVATADDDPATRADDVTVTHETLPDGGVRVVGSLDAEPDAPYLAPGYEPFAGIDPDLIRAAGLEPPRG